MEYVIWGVPPGAKEEMILLSHVRNPKGERVCITDHATAKRLAEWCRQKKGATKVRIQCVDLSKPFDATKEFQKSVRKGKGKQ